MLLLWWVCARMFVSRVNLVMGYESRYICVICSFVVVSCEPKRFRYELPVLYEAVIFGKCIVFIWRCIFGMIDVSGWRWRCIWCGLGGGGIVICDVLAPLGAHFPGCQTAFSMAANHSLICISQQIGCQLAIEKKRRWNESKTMIHINHKSHGETIRHRSDASDCRHTVRIPFAWFDPHLLHIRVIQGPIEVTV